ncbi:hypothetical protein GQ607_016948, partial [Colletotrichum asianum]
LIKYTYFILYKEVSNTKEYIYIFCKYIITNYRILKEIISNRNKSFTFYFEKLIILYLNIK